MSVDGYIAGPNGEMDWLIWNWDDKLKKYVNELTKPVDTILLGRKMTIALFLIGLVWWTNLMTLSICSQKRWLKLPKIVFTKTLNKSEWINTEVSNGDLRAEISRIRNQQGRDIIVYGGASFDSSLIKEKLIDEFYLFINPVAVGTGMPIFKDLNDIQKFTLIESIGFDCGIVLLHYETTKNWQE